VVDALTLNGEAQFADRLGRVQGMISGITASISPEAAQQFEGVIAGLPDAVQAAIVTVAANRPTEGDTRPWDAREG
jgi:hypothetical protein